MKKILCTSLSAFLFLSGNITSVKAAKLHETITSAGKNAEVYTSSDASDTSSVKTAVLASFIKDSNDSNLTALVSVKGFIPSKLTRYGHYYNGFMDWTSQYDMVIESSDTNNTVKILESIPHNQIETVDVTETIGYSIGGNISVSKGSGSGGGNNGYSVQRSIKYQQPDFKTIQRSDGLTKSSWSLVFNKTKYGYDRDSYNILYGNELFMKTRYSNTGINNLFDDKDLSPLISGGFTPDIVTALKAPKNIEKSIFSVTYKTYQDLYSVKWSGTEWRGSNIKARIPNSITHTYELDWKNNTVKFLY